MTRTDLKVALKSSLADDSTFTQTKTVQGVNASSTVEQLEGLANGLSSFLASASSLTAQRLVITDLFDESDEG